MLIDYSNIIPKTVQPIILIGAGGIVHDAHMPAYRKAGFEVYGITNRTKSRAEKLAAHWNIPNVFDSLKEAVANAPANTVYDITIMPEQFVSTLEQLPDNVAVLIQKPMGDHIGQSREILEICRKKNLVAAINCQLRFAPFVQEARKMINEGLLGEIYDMEVRVTVNTPWHLFPHVMIHPRLEIQYHSIHYIDLIRSFLGDPVSVMASTVGHPEKELSSTRTSIILNYSNKLRATIQTNHDHDFGLKHQESYIKWEGTKGVVKAKMGLLMDYPNGVPDSFDYCIKDEKGVAGEWKQKQIQGSWFPDAFIGTMGSLMCAKEASSNHLPTSVEDVYKTMLVVEAAYASNDRGGIAP